MSLDVVVLPHPDSPTSPRVSPEPMLKEMPSTARIQPRIGPNGRLPRIGKYFLRSSTRMRGPPTWVARLTTN